MKILNITDLANGGLATYLEMIYNKQSMEHEVYILASTSNSEERIIKLEGFLSLDPYTRSMKGMLSGFKTSRKYIQNIQPDILYIHSSFAGVFARLATLGLKNKPKIIYCAHGWAFLMQGNPLKKFIFKWIEKILSYSTDAIITISKNEHEAAIQAGINTKKLYQIEHGISTIREKLNNTFIDANTFSNNKINILFIGRYDYAKGFDWLMNFIENNPTDNICWHIAGKSIVDQEVLIPKDVIDHGWVHYNLIPQLLLRCDAVIMPSRWEGFGLSAIEAMKYGKPVIASNNGALPDLIKDGKNGWLFSMNNNFELVNLLQALSLNKLNDIGNTGYKIFLKKYSESKMFESLDSLIYTLLSTKHN